MPLTTEAADKVAKQIVDSLNLPPESAEKARSNWSAVVYAIFAGITQNAVVQPDELIAPDKGGPVTGAGRVV